MTDLTLIEDEIVSPNQKAKSDFMRKNIVEKLKLKSQDIKFVSKIIKIQSDFYGIGDNDSVVT